MSESHQPIPLLRLIPVELRKAVDTRSGLTVMLILLGVSLLVMFVVGLFGAVVSKSTTRLFTAGLTPAAMIIPVIGILLVTGEFAHRTALTTFALVPRRGTVIAAKLLGALLLALALTITLMVAAFVLSALTGDGSLSPDADRSIGPGRVLRAFGALLLPVVTGVAFGLLLQSSPLAIVSYYVAPTMLTIMVSLIEALRPLRSWLTLDSWGPLLGDGAISSEQWQQLAVSVGFWTVLPLVLGLVRLSRTEIK